MKYVIYKIVCNNIEVPYIYVGSTKDFTERIRMHKCDSKRKMKAHRKVYRIIKDHGGWDNFSFVKLETCVCESKAEAVKIEQKYYDELNENKMNTIRPMITSEESKKVMAEYSKQYNIDNKISIKEQRTQYQNNNKETISTHKSEKIHCEVCDFYHNRSNIARHNKSPTHQNNIKILQSIP